MKLSIKRLLSKLNPKGYFSRSIGEVYYSYWHSSTIIVTRHFDDRHWYFKKYDLIQGMPYGRERQAVTPLSFFEEDKKKRPNFTASLDDKVMNHAVPPAFRGASHRKRLR